MSTFVFTFCFAIGCQKLGHPVPESNFVSELNNALPQQIQRYIPLSCDSAYFPVNGGSVPASRVISNSCADNCCFHSASVLRTFCTCAGPSSLPSSLN